MEATRIVLIALLAVMLLATGGGKLAGAESSHAIRDSLHVPAGRWKIIGALEMVGVIGLVVGAFIPAVAVAAAVGVAALMIGAIITRWQAEKGWSAGIGADAIVLAMAVAAAVLSAQAI